MLAKARAMPAPPAPVLRRAVVALGANLGDRQATLDQAVALMGAELGTVAAQSSWLHTPALIHPVDPAHSYPEFLNGAVLLQSALPPEALLAGLHRIEARLAPIPVLVGTSRKGFLGGRLAERDPVSQLTALVAAEKGAALIRTHEVRMAAQFLDAAERLGRPLPARTTYA